MTLLQAESATAICQRALGWAEHTASFDSLEDTSTLARTCRLRYDIRRRAVLEALDWQFARRRVLAQAIAGVIAPQQYPAAWARPQDCLRIRGIFSNGVLLNHTIEEHIFTEAVPTPQIVFTVDKTNPAIFPPVFTTALEFLLASEFAMIFARSVNRSDTMLQNFRRTMDEADAMEAFERSETDAYASSGWTQAIETPWIGGAF